MDAQLNKNIEQIFESNYVVPLYQRNYAWREEQISTLLQDVYESFDKTNGEGNYFIGSLIVLKRRNGCFEVIDGQQRLTTLSLITKILDINDRPVLSYDSRPEVEEFFARFYDNDKWEDLKSPLVLHLKNAVEYINETNLSSSDNNIKISNKEWKNRAKFIDFFRNNVILVRVEIPQDTDVASYFEIMNNRGEQLQKHEILKALLLSRIKNGERFDVANQKQFAQIWDACSQMDCHIQKLFCQRIKDKSGNVIDMKDRERYFGSNYDSFSFKNETEDLKESIGYSIIDIIKDSFSISSDEFVSIEDSDFDESNESASDYNSIIDFPNFLMHVLKVYYGKDYSELKETAELPLNEKYLLEVYEVLKEHIKPMEFIKQLLFCRVVFDRYIVKTIEDTKAEDGAKWSLQKPKKYENVWGYIDSFVENKDDQEGKKHQERVVKALSMLQVTFRTRIYKNWLQKILVWFKERYQKDETNGLSVSYEDYISKVDEIVLKNFEQIAQGLSFAEVPDEEDISTSNSICLGTNTHHFIFNFIDYLIWVKEWWRNDNVNNRKINDFDFKYWNSVEHHLAQHKGLEYEINEYDRFKDCLGNLCLISKSTNSSLSDRDVSEKVKMSKGNNLGANRQIIYKETKDDVSNAYSWTRDKIKKHYNYLMGLINNREEILKVQFRKEKAEPI